jgi:2'-5' RNA ligase
VPGTGPLGLSLGEPGVFPTSPAAHRLGRRVRPAGAGAAAGSTRAPVGGDRPSRPRGAYHPHLTLGRVREGHRLPERAIEELQAGYQPLSFLVEQLVLYESIAGRGAPTYAARVSLELAA